MPPLKPVITDISSFIMPGIQFKDQALPSPRGASDRARLVSFADAKA